MIILKGEKQMSDKKQVPKQEKTQPAKDKPNPYPLRDFNSEVEKNKVK